MKDILKTIGNTPSVEVLRTDSGGLFAKLEYFNPTGSVKDRASLFMIMGAFERGEIKAGARIVEPTSGNTGIGLALVAKAFGLSATLVMPENMSKERVNLIKAYGAEVVLTPASEGMAGATTKAKQITDSTPNSFMPNQFENPDNVRAHTQTTAPEIFSKHPNLKWVVCGVGSGGTAMGIKKYINENGLACKVCAVEPSGSPLMSKGVTGGHKIQGIGANFLPKLVDKTVFDKIITVCDIDAFEGARDLAAYHGISGGISAGAAFVAAKTLVCEGDTLFVVPDTALRYLSMGIYD